MNGKVDKAEKSTQTYKKMFQKLSQKVIKIQREQAGTRGPDRKKKFKERPESIIECIAIFYQKAKTKLDYVRKERYRARIPTGIKSLTKLKSIVRYVNFKFILQ